jgi:hypothetical protein
MSDILQKADEIRAGAEKTKMQVEEKRDQLKKKAEDAWDDTLELVKKHPGKALGIAVGTGFALGSLIVAISKRRDESPAERLKGLADSGADAWGRVRGGFSEAISTLKDAMDDAVAKLK